MEKKLNIFCFLSMLDLTVEHSLKPIIMLPQVENLFVFRLRHNPGPYLDKTTYFCNKFRFNILNIIFEFFYSIALSKKYKPDIIISYYIKPHGFVALLVGKIINVPVNYNVMSGPEEFKLLRLGRTFDRQSSILENFLISITSQFDYITTTGTKTKEYLIANGISKELIKILPDSVDLDKFVPINQNKFFDLIYVARLDPIKRQDLFLHMISKLAKKYPDIKAGIVGDGPKYNSLKKLITSLGIKKNVVMLGYREDVELFYHNSRILVLCSEREGLPMVVLEAMGCGLPCVVSDVGDINDLITNNFNGYIVPDYNDIDLFVESIDKLLSSKQNYDMISSNSISTVREKYSYKAATEVWQTILSEI